MKSPNYLILLFTLFLLNFTTASYACSCQNFIGMAEHISGSEIIFSGTVTNAQFCQLETDDNEKSSKVQIYTIEISNAFKGINNTSIEIITGLGFGDCGDHFAIGEEYLIFAYDSGKTKKNDGLYETNICKWNGLLIEKKDYLEILTKMKSDGVFNK